MLIEALLHRVAMPMKASQLPADGGAVPLQPPSDLGIAEVEHALMKDADAFAFGKMGVGHRRPVLSTVVSW
jgi:hypothetical protein